MILDILNDSDVRICKELRQIYTSADGGDVIGRPRLNGAGGSGEGRNGDAVGKFTVNGDNIFARCKSLITRNCVNNRVTDQTVCLVFF